MSGSNPARLVEALGIDRAVLCAPMAGISGGVLAAAVSEAGGLGFIGGAYGDVAWIDEQVEVAGGTPIGIGIITWNMASGALDAVATVEEGVHAHRAGADVFVAQGREAGGHGRAKRTLFTLVPALRAAIPTAAIVAPSATAAR